MHSQEEQVKQEEGIAGVLSQGIGQKEGSGSGDRLKSVARAVLLSLHPQRQQFVWSW